MATTGPTSLFAFDDVRLVIDDTVVLDAVTADIPAGRLVAVVGASGSGKSTLLRLCNRLEAPTSGTVRFRGDDVRDLDVRTLRRQVGMVFQRPTPFPGTVLDNLRVADPSLTADAAGALLVDVALDASFLDRDADGLSGGEAQRMCTARSLATRPEVLLMDEPTSALDDDATRELEALARGLVEGGVSVLWVTHDRAQVERLADEVVRVDAGRIVT